MDLHRARKAATLIAYITNYLGLIDAYVFLAERIAKSRVAILTYHQVGDPDEFPWCTPLVRTRDFEKQVKYLCREYEILPLDTLVRHIQEKDYWPRKAAVITFDDGYRNNLKYAYPILEKYNVPATINLTTAHIGTGNLFWFDKVKFCVWHTKHEVVRSGELGTFRLRSSNDRIQVACRIIRKLDKLAEKEKNLFIDCLINTLEVEIPSDLGKELILSWDEVREMCDAGISFGSHSLNHPNMAKLPVEQAKHQIVQSKMDIEERLGKEVTVFCYPNGDLTTEVSELVKEAGCHCALTTRPMMINPESNPYKLGRIPGGWSVDTLKLFCSGAYSAIDTILRRMSGEDRQIWVGSGHQEPINRGISKESSDFWNQYIRGNIMESIMPQSAE